MCNVASVGVDFSGHQPTAKLPLMKDGSWPACILDLGDQLAWPAIRRLRPNRSISVTRLTRLARRQQWLAFIDEMLDLDAVLAGTNGLDGGAHAGGTLRIMCARGEWHQGLDGELRLLGINIEQGLLDGVVPD